MVKVVVFYGQPCPRRTTAGRGNGGGLRQNFPDSHFSYPQFSFWLTKPSQFVVLPLVDFQSPQMVIFVFDYFVQDFGKRLTYYVSPLRDSGMQWPLHSTLENYLDS